MGPGCVSTWAELAPSGVAVCQVYLSFGPVLMDDDDEDPDRVYAYTCGRAHAHTYMYMTAFSRTLGGLGISIIIITVLSY